MAKRATELAKRLESFCDDLLWFVENHSDEEWNKTLTHEEWSVGVTARHIGAGHLAIIDLVNMIINREPLPDFTEQMLTDMANEHARNHAHCTRSEVAEIVRVNSAALCSFVADLSEASLDRKGYFSLIGGEVTTERFIEMVVLQSGGEHFDNMKKALTG